MMTVPAATATPLAPRRATPQHVRAFRTIVRGHAFASVPPEAEMSKAGTAVRLIREPGNPADPLAIAVWTDHTQPWRLGYLDRSVAAWLAPKLDAGVAVVGHFTGWVAEPDGRWQRPVVLLHRADQSLDQAMMGTSVASGEHGPATATSRQARWAAEAGGPYLWGRLPGVTRRTVA